MSEKNSLLKRKIVKHLYYAKTLSVSELCLKVNKSLPIIGKALAELIEEGYVVETGFAASSGGRRPITYSLGDNVLFTVSVAMDQFVTRIGILDMENNLVMEEEKFEMTLQEASEALEILINRIDAVISRSRIPKAKLAGIGIGMPGFIDVKKGVNYSYPSVNGKSITENIWERLQVPAFLDNDSSLIALAEFKFGAAGHKKNAMVINAGWGIGLGMILNGELFRGQNGFAGEFSHMSLFNNNKLCFCGKTGCLETEASLMVVIEKARKGLSEGRLSKLKKLPAENTEKAIDFIIKAAHDGDQFAIELLSDAGYKIGKGVAILIHLLNPEVVILSGRGSSAGKIWNAPMQQAINEDCIPRLAANTTIEISSLGYRAELIGAAALVMENYEQRVPEVESRGTLFKSEVATD